MRASGYMERVTMKDLGGDHCKHFTKCIRDDLQTMRHLGIGKVGKETGCFRKLTDEYPRIYVYCHPHHAAFSSLHFTDLENCGMSTQSNATMLLTVNQPQGLAICNKHRSHIFLQPFFCSNDKLLQHYQAAESEDLKEECSTLERIVKKELSSEGTLFTCPPYRVNSWKENAWTLRLAAGLSKHFPHVKVSYTAEGSSFEVMLHAVFGVKQQLKPFLASTYLFQGYTDIVLSNYSILTSSGWSDDDDDTDVCDSSHEASIENCHQRNPLVGSATYDLPEKLGELFAAMHFLLVSKLLQRVLKNKSVEANLQVKGLLLDKTVGVIRCCLSVAITSSGPAKLKFELEDYQGDYLNANSLCAHIDSILS